jgi:hypothetical protein
VSVTVEVSEVDIHAHRIPQRDHREESEVAVPLTLENFDPIGEEDEQVEAAVLIKVSGFEIVEALVVDKNLLLLEGECTTLGKQQGETGL